MKQRESVSPASENELVQGESLLAGCLQCLEQCARVLAEVDASQYTAQSPSQSSIGAHFRHILDRFHSVLSGLPAGCINYDDRRRDAAVESNLEAARFALTTIVRRVQALSSREIGTRSVAVVESVHSTAPAVRIASSVEREFMALITHTTHHLALLAVILRHNGMQLDPEFGKAPSTLIYERQ